MKKSFLACCFVLVVASMANAETVVEQTVIVQKDSDLKSFSVVTDKKAVEAMRQGFPEGMTVGSVTHELFCAKNHGAFTNFILGECEEKAKR